MSLSEVADASAGSSGAAADAAIASVAIVGCSRGIGRALFEHFAGAGFKVAGCGTSREPLESLRQAHPKCLTSVADIRSEEAVARWIAEVSEAVGQIDVLVCCAGFSPSPGKLWETSADDWSQVCDVNILGTARVLRHAVPKLKAPGAKVVLISSRYGRSVASGQGCYSATKWSTEAMAKTSALELRDRGIAVVSLDPGIVDTEMFCRSNPGGQDCGQRAPADFAAEAGPFILSLGMRDTGRNLVCPGSPPSYFLTGVAYKDRPAWANGFGPFVRAQDEEALTSSQLPTGKRRRLDASTGKPEIEGSSSGSLPPLRYFISGVMLGSRHRLNDASTDLVSQDFRSRMAAAIRKADPEAVIVEPLDVVTERAKSFGMTVGQLSQHTDMVREAFIEVVDLAATCDIVISNLPEASMGSAAEIWEARKAGRIVFTISPMKDNWLMRSVTDHNFPDMEDFERNLKAHLPSRAPRSESCIPAAK